jgi:hypothetical protein
MADTIFILGLKKSGSTLLNQIMKPVTEAAGLVYRSPAGELFQNGRELRHAKLTFEPSGHAYGGFRNLPWRLPDFAANRTVLLTRDPRDALTSLYFSVAFSHRPPGATDDSDMLRAFEARRANAKAAEIDTFVLERAASHARLIEKTMANAPPHRLYRYEDVIFDKLAWVDDMINYFGLSAPRPLVARIVERFDVVPTEEAPYEHIRRVTPGDHKEKLRPETIAILNDRLGPILRRFGYAAETGAA